MQTFYVSPMGDDKNDGNAFAPFRTVSHALHESGGNAEIILADGCYYEYDTWNITESNITIRAAYDAHPVISGGVRFTGWKPANDPERPSLMRAALPDGINYSRHFYINGRRAERVHGPVITSGVWDIIDDPDMRLARKIGEVMCDKVYEKTGRGMSGIYEGYLASNLDMLNWRNKTDIEFVYDVGWTHCIVPVDNILPDDDAEDKAFVKMRSPAFRNCLSKGGVQIGSPNYIENAYELLGSPGHWYIDREERAIYYTPFEDEDLSSSVCLLPFTEKFINIMGTPGRPVHNITISSLTFAYTTWLKPSEEGYAELQSNMLFDGTNDEYEGPMRAGSAVSLYMCGNVRFENSFFTRLGANAIDIDRGVFSIVINACKFEDISGSAIQMGGFGEKDAQPDDHRNTVRDIVVSNCYISHIGLEYKGAEGIIAGYVQNVEIVHNEIGYCSHSGVALGWGWGIYEPGRDSTFMGAFDPKYTIYNRPTICMRNSVMYNHIHHVMSKMHDGAGIYTLGLQSGSLIKGNYIHDNRFSGEREKEAQFIKIYLNQDSILLDKNGETIPFEDDWTLFSRPGFPGGIYLDGSSGGFYVCENIAHSVAMPFFMNDPGIPDRRVTNFVFDNSFNIYPDDDGFPETAARRAGIQPEFELSLSNILHRN